MKLLSCSTRKPRDPFACLRVVVLVLVLAVGLSAADTWSWAQRGLARRGSSKDVSYSSRVTSTSSPSTTTTTTAKLTTNVLATDGSLSGFGFAGATAAGEPSGEWFDHRPRVEAVSTFNEILAGSGSGESSDWQKMHIRHLKLSGALKALKASDQLRDFSRDFSAEGSNKEPFAGGKEECVGEGEEAANGSEQQFWEDAWCPFFVVQGDLQVQGDLKIGGRLVVLSGMDMTSLLGDSSQLIRLRCSKGEVLDERDQTIIDGSGGTLSSSTKVVAAGTLLVPQADVYVAGSVHVGASLFAADVVVNASGRLLVGMNAFAKSIRHEKLIAAGAHPNTKVFDSEWLSTAEDAIAELACPVLGPYGRALAPPSKTTTFAEYSLAEAMELSATFGSGCDAALAEGDVVRPLGDLAALGGRLVADNAATVVVFGNVQSSSIVLNGASAMHAFCGHVYTNSESGPGMTVLGSSVISAGGLFESQSVGLVVQGTSTTIFRGGLVATGQLQADDASFVYVGKSIMAPIIAVDDHSAVIARRNLEAPLLAETIDNGKIFIVGNVTVGSLECYDGGEVYVGRAAADDDREDDTADTGSHHSGDASSSSSIFAKDMIVVDQGSTLSLAGGGNVFTGNSLHVSNSSSFVIADGDLFVDGLIRVVASLLSTDGSVVATRPFLTGQASRIAIGRDLVAAGTTAADLAKPDDAQQKDEVETPPGEAGSTAAARLLSELTRKPGAPRRRMSSSSEENSEPPTETPPASESIEEKTNGGALGGGGPLPAIYGERASLVVGGKMRATNSWIEFVKNSSVAVLNGKTSEGAVGNPGDGVEVATGMVIVKGESTLDVAHGGIGADVGLALDKVARVTADSGSVLVDFLDVQGGSVLSARGIQVGRDFFMGGQSRVQVLGSQPVSVGGGVISIDEKSTVVVPGLVVTDGDVFVEDGSELRTLLTSPNGDVKARGYVVAQDGGCIYSGRNIVSFQADVVAENTACLVANSGMLYAPNGFARVTVESHVEYDPALQAQIVESFHQQPPAELVAALAAARDQIAESLKPLTEEEKKQNAWGSWEEEEAEGGV